MKEMQQNKLKLTKEAIGAIIIGEDELRKNVISFEKPFFRGTIDWYSGLKELVDFCRKFLSENDSIVPNVPQSLYKE